MERPRSPLGAALVGLLALCALALGPRPARADTRRLVVEGFVGPGAASTRGGVLRGLSDRVELVAREDVDRALGALGAARGSPASYRAVAARLQVDAFVSGRVSRAGRRLSLHLRVHDGATGELAAETRFSARRPAALARAAEAHAYRRLGRAIEGTTAPAADARPAAAPLDHDTLRALEREAPPDHGPRQEPLEAPVPATSESLDPELFGASRRDAEVAFEPAHSPLEARAAVGLINRGLRYTGASEGLRPYDLPLGPRVMLGAELFPGALFSNGPLAHVGVVLEASHSVGLSSEGPNGVAYPTTDARLTLGLLGRVPIGEGRIELRVAFGRHDFEVEPSFIGDGEPAVASVGYEHVELGVGARIPMGAFALHVGGAFLAVTDLGEIGTTRYYPQASGLGLSASAQLGYRVLPGLELRAGLDGRLYVLDFGDEGSLAPSGALDRHLAASAGAAFTMDPFAP